MVAGEASGDLLASLLIDGMKERWPDLQADGIGGPHMMSRGFKSLWPQEKLAVRGYVEVLRHYREIVGIRDQLKARLLEPTNRPDMFIGVDAPDFNLGLESALKQSGIPTVHFVCPSIWAWRPKRVVKIKESVDHVLCIFPFEPELLESHGIAATYVGHPLANVIPMEPDKKAARDTLGLSERQKIVALLPGSRESEVKYLAGRFLQAAVVMHKADPSLQFLLPAIPSLYEKVNRIVQDSGAKNIVQVLRGQSHVALAACDVTLIASGTATLEAALFKRPMVIAYNMNWLSWQMLKGKGLQPWVGLPNILCREFVVPELLQDKATPEALAESVLAWLRAPERIAALKTRFESLHRDLQRDTPKLAADAIQKILEN